MHLVKNQQPGMGITFKIRTLILDNASIKPIRMNGMMMQSYHSVVLRKLFADFCDTKSLQSVMISRFKNSNSYQCHFRTAFLLRMPM